MKKICLLVIINCIFLYFGLNICASVQECIQIKRLMGSKPTSKYTPEEIEKYNLFWVQLAELKYRGATIPAKLLFFNNGGHEIIAKIILNKEYKEVLETKN